MTSTERRTCHHCGIGFRWKALEDAEGRHGFCCRGCLGAYLLIRGAGLDAYYLRSDRTSPTVGRDTHDYDSQDLAASVRPEGPVSRIDILITGISCSSCIWLLEHVIGRLEGVVSVSLIHCEGTAAVRFDPALIAPEDIFTTIARLGYAPRPYSPDLSAKAARQEYRDLLIRFGTSLFLTMQLMAYSFALYAGFFQGMSQFMKQVLQMFSFIVATPVVFYCGWPVFRGAWRGIRTRAIGMDTLIAVGAGSAWIFSTLAALQGHETYFESAAMIVTFVLVGRLLESVVKQRAATGLEVLYEVALQRATLIDAESLREIETAEVQTDDLLLVRQGERFPVDVRIEQGETEVDQSQITGESMPVRALPGDEVKGGSLNAAAPVTARALRPAGQSYMMRVAALVRMAQASKPDIQRLADLVASRFVPAVLALAGMTLLVLRLSFAVELDRAVMTALTVLLIACPCAFGLAVPTAVTSACSRFARLGIILRGGDVIERLAQIDTVLLDKTGTVTQGRPEVIRWDVLGNFEESRLLYLAATVERLATHPLARAIERFAAENGCLAGECRDFVATPGRGVSARLEDGTAIVCGSPLFLRECGVPLARMPELDNAAGTIVVLAVAGCPAGFFVISDPIRHGAREAVLLFKQRRIETWLVSGDAEAVVDRTSRSLGLDHARSECTPDDKLDLVRELHAAGRQVLLAGDGINDAPALAAAQVSCSISGSSDIALENADMVITGSDLSQLPAAHALARAAMRIIRQNLAWAFLYNLVGIPLAMCGMLTPAYAAAAMTISSLTVSLNSLRLMRVRIDG